MSRKSLVGSGSSAPITARTSTRSRPGSIIISDGFHAAAAFSRCSATSAHAAPSAVTCEPTSPGYVPDPLAAPSTR